MNLDAEALKAKNDLVEIVRRYVPELKQKGKDWWACCPFHAEKTPSFKVSPEQWFKCHGCGTGGDIFTFLENIERVDFQGAVKILSGTNGNGTNGNGTHGNAYIAPPTPVVAEWIPKEEEKDFNLPVPDDAPPCRFVHQGLSQPAAIWAYRDKEGRLLGYDARYEDAKGNKTKVLPWRYMNGQWRMKGFAAPTPLYGLEDLQLNPGVPAMFVEGCKSVDAGRVMFYGPPGSVRRVVVVGWQGGANAVGKIDLTPVYGRPILLWPDADSEAKKLAGQKCMQAIGNKLAHHCPKVSYFEPNPKIPCTACKDGVDDLGQPCAKCHGTGKVYQFMPMPDGWDAADALSEGWTWEKWKEWANPRVRPISMASAEYAIDEEKGQKTKGIEKTEKKKKELPAQYMPYQSLWYEWNLKMQSNFQPHASLDNVCTILDKDPNIKGLVYYDTFLQKTYNCHSKREWADEDEVNLMLYIQRNAGIQKVGRTTIAEAIVATAYKDLRNCVHDWLETLVWDGVPRIEKFFPDFFDAADNKYTQAVGRCFLMSLVARAYLPGCKADHMVVLEGTQGIRKSSALEALCGSNWYADVNESVTSKDFFQGIQGKWLVELGEMGSLDKSDRESVKQMLSRRSDRYRGSYGRYSFDHPRQCIFCGTTNRDNWNKDESGARRFWPIRCREIDLKGIFAAREQLFAEAVAKFKAVPLNATEAERVAAGADWWITPSEETKREQEARYEGDPWTEPVLYALNGKNEISLGELLTDILKIDTGKQGPGEQRRVSAILRHHGWTKNVEREAGTTKINKTWRPRESEYDI